MSMYPPLIARWLTLLPALCAAALLGGCLILEDHLTVHADGSGSVALTVTMDDEAETMAMMGPQVGALMPLYPPTDAADAAELFAGDAFDVDAEPLIEPGRSGVRITARFADIDTLLNSRYAAARGLTVERGEDGSVRVVAVAGLSGLKVLEAAFAEEGGGMIPPSTRRQLLAQLEKTEATFHVTLPGDVAAEAPAAVEGDTATWSLHRADAASAEAFHEQLSGVMTASAAGPVAFDPPDPPRPVRQAFDDLAEGSLGAAASVDPDDVAEAAAFFPVSLTLERSFDLSGEGRFLANSAKLSGVVVIPAELAPRRWGEPTFDTIADDEGNDLRPREDDRHFRSHRSGMGWMGDDPGARADGLERHMLEVAFTLPPRSARSVRFEGSLHLRYGGAERVIKIADVIAADQIEQQSADRMFFGGGGFGRDGRPLRHDLLGEFGLEVAVSHASQAGDMLGIGLDVEGEGGTITAAQVYDGDGRPWPTMASPTMDEALVILVAGRPEAPLSLALTVEGGGPAVTLPIRLHDVPLHKQPETQ